MKKSGLKEYKITRRSFLLAMGALALSGGLSACGSIAESKPNGISAGSLSYTLTITGGDIAVWTVDTADNQPLDADGLITISGGTVLAAGGSAGMGYSLQADQPCVTFGGGRDQSVSLEAGRDFSITDADGKSVLDATAVCDAAFVFFSSADLTADRSYSLSSQVSATAQTGESQPQFGGGNGGPGGGQMPQDGQNPPEGMTPPDGQMPSGSQPPQNADGTPPELPAASNS